LNQFYLVPVLLLTLWAVGSIVTKPTLGSHSQWQSRTVVWIVALSWWLLFDRGLTGLLGWRFLPASSVAACGGLALTTAGLALALWARLYIGAIGAH